MPTYSGRIVRTWSLSVVIECCQPIRCAITVADIRGNSASSATRIVDGEPDPKPGESTTTTEALTA